MLRCSVGDKIRAVKVPPPAASIPMIQSLGACRALAVVLVVVGCAAAPAVVADPGPADLGARLNRALQVPALRGARFSALVLDART